MKVLDAVTKVKESLQQRYELREANNIIRSLFQDLYSITNLSSGTLLTEHQLSQLETAIEKLQDGMPIDYVTGVTYFYGYKFMVNKNVLIPRPETEELIYWIERDLKKLKKQYDIIDIGTGSGCIPISLKKKMPWTRVFGVEKSLDALNVSRINAKKLDVLLELFRVDFLDESYWGLFGKFDVIVSNPPYISYDEIDRVGLNTLSHEPEIALFVEESDPLVFYRKIINFSKVHLKDNGRIYVEINEFLDKETMKLFMEHFDKVTLKNDLQNKPRMIKASRPK